MGRFLPFVLVGLLTLYVLVEIVQSPNREVRTFPRLVWGLIVLLFPVLGAVGWFAFGRPKRRGSGRKPPRPFIAPDDDPDFLRRL